MEPNPAAGAVLLILFFVFLFIYFLPSIVALSRSHPQRGLIVVVNMFLGWTFIIWVGCLAFACSAKAKPITIVGDVNVVMKNNRNSRN